jgi:thermostable 8-oxoguanine DNA glycosylase
MLIDPEKLTNFTRNDAELEAVWLFSLVVAGKAARTQARLLDGFIRRLDGATPFDGIRNAIDKKSLLRRVKASRLGQWTRLTAAFAASVHLDLRTCTVEDLETIPGCGPKTARLFIMHTRPEQRYAAIDTHILKLLREEGFAVPKATPPAGSRYRDLEIAFLKLADASGMSPADFDLAVWTRYSRRENGVINA